MNAGITEGWYIITNVMYGTVIEITQTDGISGGKLVFGTGPPAGNQVWKMVRGIDNDPFSWVFSQLYGGYLGLEPPIEPESPLLYRVDRSQCIWKIYPVYNLPNVFQVFAYDSPDLTLEMKDSNPSGGNPIQINHKLDCFKFQQLWVFKRVG